jgi:hypothetical protein
MWPEARFWECDQNKEVRMGIPEHKLKVNSDTPIDDRRHSPVIHNIHVFHTRWFKYDRDKLWLIYTQSVPVIFEPPCVIGL